MTQQKLFYNAIQDAWNYAKELPEKGSDIPDEEWESLIQKIAEIRSKYEKLGKKEATLVSSLLFAFGEYIKKEEQ